MPKQFCDLRIDCLNIDKGKLHLFYTQVVFNCILWYKNKFKFRFWTFLSVCDIKIWYCHWEYGSSRFFEIRTYKGILLQIQNDLRKVMNLKKKCGDHLLLNVSLLYIHLGKIIFLKYNEIIWKMLYINFWKRYHLLQ